MFLDTMTEPGIGLRGGLGLAVNSRSRTPSNVMLLAAGQIKIGHGCTAITFEFLGVLGDAFPVFLVTGHGYSQ